MLKDLLVASLYYVDHLYRFLDNYKGLVSFLLETPERLLELYSKWMIEKILGI